MFELDKVRVGLSDKADGNMKAVVDGAQAQVAQNRQKFLAAMGLEVRSTYFVRIDYGNTDDFCRFMRAGENNGLWLGSAATRCDGLLTTQENKGLFLPLADCLGMMLYDPRNGAMMVVHCGRHTVLQDGAYRAVRYMMEEVGTEPESVVAWLSPSAGKENYPLHGLDGASMQEVVMEQLMRAGVAESEIQKLGIDTTTDGRYFSHSQGDREERFAIVGVIDGRRTG
jgi:copper oxidase (laccase) domain-containing protein